MIDAYTDHDDYMDDEDDHEDVEEWQEGRCDNCYGGDENGITADGTLGPVFCACFIGQGASEENCRCGPPADSE
jgi:hypothetical protein